MMCTCDKCLKICGFIFLALGIVFLLANLGIWNFWGIEWYTALFLAVGLGSVASSGCVECKAVRKGK